MCWFDNQLVGVFAGLLLGLIGTWALELRRERRQVQAVRTMIRIEVEQNLRILEKWDEVLPARGAPVIVEETPEERNRREWAEVEHRAKAMVDHPLSSWIQLAWTSQTTIIPRTFNPTEIERIAAFYAALNEISAICTSLVEADSADRTAILSYGADWQPPQKYIYELDKRVSQVREPIMSLLYRSKKYGRGMSALLEV